MLLDAARRELKVEACASCGAFWLHETWEVAMNGNFDELEQNRFVRLTDAEAATLPASPADTDLAFLADRDVLKDGIGGRSWVKGWAP